MEQLPTSLEELVNQAESNDRLLIYQRYFSDGIPRVIGAKDLPTNILKRFDNMADNLVSPEDEVKPIEELLSITHDNGDVSYVARHSKDYRYPNMTEGLLYILETRANEEIGHAEIAYRTASIKDDPCIYRPFIAFIKTEELHQKQGLGARKLLMLNALSQMEFGEPLHSGGPTADAMIRQWERLVALKKAEKFIQNGYEKYRFKP